MPAYLFLAVFASLLFGAGAALMKQGVAARFPKISLTTLLKDLRSILGTLAASKAWTGGILANLAGGACMIQAQSMGDLSVVLPLANLTCAFAVIFGVAFLAERLAAMEWTGLIALIGGAVLIGLSAAEATGEATDMTRLLLLTAGFGAAIALGLAAPKVLKWPSPEIAFSICTGLFFGLGYVYLKATTNMVNDQLGAFSVASLQSWIGALKLWPMYMVIATNIAAFILMQVAYSHGRVSLANPLITILANMTPAFAAMVVFGEQVNAMRGAGLIVIAAGTLVVALAGARDPGQA